jgi:hypothetical protein
MIKKWKVSSLSESKKHVQKEKRNMSMAVVVGGMYHIINRTNCKIGQK